MEGDHHIAEGDCPHAHGESHEEKEGCQTNAARGWRGGIGHWEQKGAKERKNQPSEVKAWFPGIDMGNPRRQLRDELLVIQIRAR